MALRQPHYLGLTLSLSLALNLFAAGAFFGGWFAGRGATEASGVSFSGLVAALPGSLRDQAQAALVVREADLRLRIDALREARAAASDALLAEPFFVDMLESGLSDVRARGGDVQAGLHDVVIDMVADLEATDRAALADLLFAGTGDLRLAQRPGATILAVAQ